MARGRAGVVDTTQQIQDLVGEQSWQPAFTVVATALKSSPNDVNLLVWESVLAEQLGRNELAQSSLTQAQTKFAGTPAAFWTLVGNDRLDAGNWDGADEAAQQALTLAPEDANVTFLLGRIAEARGNMTQANDYYNQTIKLAGNANPQLIALVKIRMGFSSLQSAGPLPNAAPVPDVTQTITP